MSFKEKTLKNNFFSDVGKWSIIYNVFQYLGWQNFTSFYDYIGTLVEKKLGNKDATFRDVNHNMLAHIKCRLKKCGLIYCITF